MSFKDTTRLGEPPYLFAPHALVYQVRQHGLLIADRIHDHIYLDPTSSPRATWPSHRTVICISLYQKTDYKVADQWERPVTRLGLAISPCPSGLRPLKLSPPRFAIVAGFNSLRISRKRRTALSSRAAERDRQKKQTSFQ